MKRIRKVLAFFCVVLLSAAISLLWYGENLVLAEEYMRNNGGEKFEMDINGFIMDPTSRILIKPYTNVHGHVYPYTATFVTCGCIVTVLVIIIICAPNLNGNF